MTPPTTRTNPSSPSSITTLELPTLPRSRAATPLLTLDKVCNDFQPAPRWLSEAELALAHRSSGKGSATAGHKAEEEAESRPVQKRRQLFTMGSQGGWSRGRRRRGASYSICSLTPVFNFLPSTRLFPFLCI